MANSSDIAKYLGISRGTVSRALNNNGRISPETRRQVLAAAAELGYQPNRAARALVNNRIHKAAICYFSRPESFWSIVQEGIQFAYDDLKHFGFELDIVINDLDKPSQQIDQIRQLMHSGVQAIAVAPNDPVLLDTTIADLHRNDVPIITFNADIPSRQRLCYVGGNYYSEGRLAASLFATLMGESGKVGSISYRDPVITNSQRVKGFADYMADFPGIDVVSLAKLQRSGDDAYEATRGFLRDHPDVKGIFVSLGATEQVAQAVMDSGMERKVILIGFDLSERVGELLRQGVIHSIIFQEPSMQGYYTVKLLFNLLVEGQIPSTEILQTKMEIITRENLYGFTDEINRLSMLKLRSFL